MDVLIGFLQLIIGAALAGAMLWALLTLQIWWTNRPLRKLSTMCQRLLGEMGAKDLRSPSPFGALNDLLDDYERYLSQDGQRHPDSVRIRQELAEAIRRWIRSSGL